MNKVIYNPPRLKKRRRTSTFKISFFLKVVSPFLILGGFFYFLFLTSYFQINPIREDSFSNGAKEIKILGAAIINQDDLMGKVNEMISKKTCFLFKKDNLFLFPSKKIKSTLLKDFPKIKEVAIKKSFPNFVKIEIQERKMAAIWCDLTALPQNCFFIDKDGTIFEEAPSVDGSLIFKIDGKFKTEDIKLGAKIFEPGFLDKIFDSKRIFEENLGASFPNFTVLEDNVLEANSSLGWKIIFDSSSDLGLQIEALKKIFAEMKPEEREILEYFDLRIGGRIYYK